MQRAVVVTLVFVLTISTGSLRATFAQGDAATPAAEIGVDFVFPMVEQIPEGMVIISDGERTLDDVATGFTDPAAAIARFEAWGWQGNRIRAFHIADESESDPQAIDGIYISVHQFASAESAAEALDYSVAEHLLDPVVTEVTGPAFGDASRALSGDMAYGTEMTFYVQDGPRLIRLSTSSPEGDPTAEAIRLMEVMLAAQPATPEAA